MDDWGSGYFKSEVFTTRIVDISGFRFLGLE